MFRRPLPFLAAALFVLPLGACTSWKLETPVVAPIAPGAPAPEGAAKVCVARTSVYESGMTVPTRDNGVLVGATEGPGYFCYLAAPGGHEIVADHTCFKHYGARERFTALAGHVYYLEQTVFLVGGSVNCQSGWVEGEENVARMFRGPYRALVDVPGGEKLPDPNAIVPSVPAVPAEKWRPSLPNVKLL